LRGKEREGPLARWRWMGRRDAEAEGVVVGKKKLIAMAEDLRSESWEEDWLPLCWRQGVQRFWNLLLK
jgi:hypothetical protein